MKDQISKLMKSHVAYQSNCPGCNKRYIGKTEQNLCTRTEEHASTVLTKIVPFIIILEFALTTIILKVSSALKTIHSMKYNSIPQKSKIRLIDSTHNWNILLLKE